MKTIKTITHITYLFSLCSIYIFLQGCNNEIPYPAEASVKVMAADDNPCIRSESEAISISLEGYDHFFRKNGHNLDSRSAHPLVMPKNVITVYDNNSRGITTNNQLLYIVNFENEMGYAVVSASKYCDPILAVSYRGTYDEELLIEVPGIALWMDNAISYAKSRQSTLNDSIVPIFPDPNQPKLQVKEWNDTTSHIYVKPQLPIAWGQGGGNTTNLESSNCEGFYFSNGICGCATLAIAQICAGLQYPATLNETYPGVGTEHTFDWTNITRHKSKRVGLNGNESERGSCAEYDKATTHQSVARLCRIIGTYGKATPDRDQTGMTQHDILSASNLVFGYDHVSKPWKNLGMNCHFQTGTMLIVTGNSKYEGKPGHAWVCDGCEHVTYTHYFATRTSSYQEWQIQSSFVETTHYLHFNWGWNGTGNGWYLSIEPDAHDDVYDLDGYGYTDLQYITITR